MWISTDSKKPSERSTLKIYAVNHQNHGVMLARGDEADWDNGRFTAWFEGYVDRLPTVLPPPP